MVYGIEIGFNLATLVIAVVLAALLTAIYFSWARIVAVGGALLTSVVGNAKAVGVITIVLLIAIILAIQQQWFWLIVVAVVAAIGLLLYNFRAQIGTYLGGLTWPAWLQLPRTWPTWLHLPTTPRGWTIAIVASVVIIGAMMGLVAYSSGWRGDKAPTTTTEKPQMALQANITENETEAYTGEIPLENKTKISLAGDARNGDASVKMDNKETFGVGYTHRGQGKLIETAFVEAKYNIDGKPVDVADSNVSIPAGATNISAKGIAGFCGSTDNSITQEGCVNLINALRK